MLMSNYEKAKGIVTKYNQEHLLNNYDKIEEGKKDKIVQQILQINFEQIKDLYKKTQSKEAKSADIIEPTSYINKEELREEELNKYKQKGLEEIRRGKLGVITMAGGQRN
jgi:UDP-N-acetylglucosamine pyrophosphorylase